jgi:hypothetical protein
MNNITNPQVEVVPGHTFSAADLALCGRVADKLNDHYPGHQWATHLNSDRAGGVLIIRNLAQSTRYGYVLHLDKLHLDPDLKKVMRAGGEMLERARMSHRYDGQIAKHVDGIKPKEQPFGGIVI